MITIETAMSFLAKVNQDIKKDPNYVMRMLAEFCKEEPNFVSLNTMFHSAALVKDPTTASLVSLALYHKLLKNQADSNDLKKGIGG